MRRTQKGLSRERYARAGAVQACPGQRPEHRNGQDPNGRNADNLGFLPFVLQYISIVLDIF